MIEPVARIRIELQGIEPRLWRRVDVPLSTTLMALHDIIQVTMQWMDYHLFEFVVGDKVYSEPVWTTRCSTAGSTRQRASASAR